MKVTAAHLEQIRLLLLEQTATLGEQTKAATTAQEARDQTGAKVRSLQGAFDVAAAGFAQDSDLSAAQLDQLPIDAQTILGYTKTAKPAAAAPAA